MSKRRGHLNLNLLPSSNMQISFTGDDGYTERLALVSNDTSSCDVIIEEITADASGRCFLLKLPNSRSLYYWCSEKSRQLGQELLAKMKDLLERKPSLSDLTGIPQSRLDAFVIHLRSYILGCTNSTTILTSSSNDSNDCSSENEIDCQPSCMDCAPVTSPIGKEHSLCHESLRPKLDFFKKQIPHLENGAMEKLKHYEDGHLSSILIDPDFVSSSSTSCSDAFSTSAQEDDKWGVTEPSHDLHCHDITSVSSPLFLFNPFSDHLASSQLSVPSIEFSPQYCWCPPGLSPHHSIAASCQPAGSSELLPLPASLSALLSDAGAAISSLPSKLPIDFSELRALTLPTFHPDPIIPISISASSIALPSSQQIPTFIPFMSDPIVHIPVIDVCSSGQGYLVSGGPAISSIVSPLLPLHVNSLVPKTESAAEKSARETIEMLIASAPPLKPNLGNALPNLLDNAKKLSANVSKSDTVAVASWSSFSCGFSTDALRSGNGRSKPEECNGEDDPDDEVAPKHAND